MNTESENPTNPSLSSQAANTASKMADQAKAGLHAAGEAIHDTAQQAAATAQGLGSRIRTAAEDLKDRAGAALHDLGEGAANMYRGASDRVRTLGEDSVDYVRENPVSTVLTAFAAGVVLGYVLHRE